MYGDVACSIFCDGEVEQTWVFVTQSEELKRDVGSW